MSFCRASFWWLLFCWISLSMFILPAFIRMRLGRMTYVWMTFGKVILDKMMLGKIEISKITFSRMTPERMAFSTMALGIIRLCKMTFSRTMPIKMTLYRMTGELNLIEWNDIHLCIDVLRVTNCHCKLTYLFCHSGECRGARWTSVAVAFCQLQKWNKWFFFGSFKKCFYFDKLSSLHLLQLHFINESCLSALKPPQDSLNDEWYEWV